MTRRRIVIVGAMAALAVVFALGRDTGSEPPPPDVVPVLTESLIAPSLDTTSDPDPFGASSGPSYRSSGPPPAPPVTPPMAPPMTAPPVIEAPEASPEG